MLALCIRRFEVLVSLKAGVPDDYNINLSPEIEVRLKAKAFTEGLSVAEYVERLVSEEDARRIRLTEFTQAIDERLRSLNGGESVDGEEVIARLIGELDEHQRGPIAR